MTFQESIRVCLSKYADFSGTASRAEYWWFVLFLGLAGAVAYEVARTYATIFFLVTLLPLLAAGTRRLQDTGRSGWWQLFGFVPAAGIIVLVVLLVQEGKKQPVVEEAESLQKA